MKEKLHSTSFFVETLLLIVVFIAVILALTQVFGAAAAESSRSGELTEAVLLAENAAEAVSASRSPEGLCAALNGNGNASLSAEGVTARFGTDLLPDAAGPYELRVSWEPEAEALPCLVDSRIEVRREGRSLYVLKTAVFCGEEAGG